ncbi:MAG TPA: DUF3347 domain-containing protein, partial [Parafilimonas sp.]|nr:DUF3347 domain-containing protein [Parafilimonas sp.]
MKSLFIVAFIMLGFSAIAQNATSNKSLQQLLTYYYDLKNALVKDDADKASASAQQLFNTAKSIDSSTLTTSEQKAFASAKEAIEHNADHISGSANIDHQREHFQALSNAMSALVQSINISDKPVYLDYCPMKKAYWLSNEKQIENPYYGKEMPDCGNVTKTITPGEEHSMQMNDNMQMNHSMSMNDKMQMNNMQMKDSAMNTSNMHNMNNMQMNNSKSMSDTMPMNNHQHDMNNMQHDSGMNNMNGMDMSMPMGNMSHSFSLNLPMSRNGSGTSWSPDAAPMYGTMYHSKNWMYMLHYNLFIRYNKQDLSDKGSRGDEMIDAPNWLMFMGQRQVGEKGLFSF